MFYNSSKGVATYEKNWDLFIHHFVIHSRDWLTLLLSKTTNKKYL